MPREDVGSWDGHLLRAMRAEAAMTQDELAQRLGIKQSTLSRWEKNYTAPPPYAMEAIRAALAADRPRPPYSFDGVVLLSVEEGSGVVVRRLLDGLGRTLWAETPTGPTLCYDGRVPEGERVPLDGRAVQDVPYPYRIFRATKGTPEQTAAAAAALRSRVGLVAASQWSTDAAVIVTRPVEGGRWKVTLGVGGHSVALPATHATPEAAELVAHREIELRRRAAEERYRALPATACVELRFAWPEIRTLRPEDGAVAWDSLP